MDSQNFVQNFAGQFEDVDSALFSLGTKFRDIEGWSSLGALSVIAMVDEAYNVKLTGDDIRNSKTIDDLFRIVNSRI